MSVSEDEAVGTFRTDEESGVGRLWHGAGWEIAMNRALAEAARRWGNGRFPGVRVEMQVDVEITNPAEVGEYRIVLRR